MSLFWVVGGDQSEKRFRDAVGSKEEWFGPFPDYAAAKQEWDKHAWQAASGPGARYRIACIDPDTPPPCTD